MVPREQQIYASWLEAGTRVGLAVLAATFAVYALGFLDPLVAHPELARLWALPVDRYVGATGAPTQWGWLGFLDKGDYLNLVGVALLALVTVACYARIIPVLLREGAHLQAGLAALQIIVLIAAAVAF